MTTRPPDARLEWLRRLSHWLDDAVRIPGTRVRIGLDPVLGLVPGVGDAAGAVLSAAVLLEAARRGVSRYTLLRIAANIGLDALLGAVPLVGDVFDAAWKANLRNIALIERHGAGPADARRADRLFLALVGGALVLLCGVVTVGGVLLTAWLIRRS